MVWSFPKAWAAGTGRRKAPISARATQHLVCTAALAWALLALAACGVAAAGSDAASGAGAADAADTWDAALEVADAGPDLADPDQNAQDQTADAACDCDGYGLDADAAAPPADTPGLDAAPDGADGDAGPDGDASQDGAAADQDAGDIAEVPPGWPGVCPPSAAELAAAATGTGFLPPNLACAKPGWLSPPKTAAPTWTDVTAQYGLAALGTVDPCVLWNDFNGDGQTDLLVIEQPAGPGSKRYVRVYANSGAGAWSSSKTELPASAWVPDCAAMDWEGDGDLDVVLATTSGVRVLLTTTVGLVDGGISGLPTVAKAAIAWSVIPFDFDRDGDHDLYVARTGQMNLQPGNYQCQPADGAHLQCCYGGAPVAKQCLLDTAATPIATWTCCAPFDLQATNLLLRNDGGKFVDISAGSNTDDPGASLAAAPGDYDRDGWTDLFVGNDFGPMHWFTGNGSGVFAPHGVDIGLRPYGHLMGAGLGDFDGNGHLDLATGDVGPVSLYLGQGGGKLLDMATPMGTLAATAEMVTWAQLVADFDNDGWPDLLALASLVAKPGQLLPAMSEWQPAPYVTAGHHVLFHNAGAKFQALTVPWLPTTDTTITPLSAAAADMDGDGDLDLLDLSPPGNLRLQRNDTPAAHWLDFALAAGAGGQGVAGAKVQVWAGGHMQEQELQLSGGSLAHRAPGVHFGLGSVAKLDHVVVWWPSGCVLRLNGVVADQVLTLEPGQAKCSGKP
ncbi:MAG: CRTAC1 family protein [Deltaproteobacteria bacterium]|nr:CRTAC1 family protein [Deltaproteobacteria bacterium]